MPVFRNSLLFLLAGLWACSKNSPPGFQLEVVLRNANPGSCYLYRLPLQGSPLLVDSFSTTRLDAQFVLKDAHGPDTCLYQLMLVNANTSLYFIPDAPIVRACINAVDPQAYTVDGSKGSGALQSLQLARKPLVDSLYILNNMIQSGSDGKAGFVEQAAILGSRLNEISIQFADTVTSPLAALFIAQQVDFGGDLGRHRAFSAGLERRFPHFSPIRAYILRLQDYFSLLEEEYMVGDTLPAKEYEDIRGRKIPVRFEEKKYYLLEFWASYCPQCLESLEQKRSLYAAYQSKGFELIAFALDEDRAQFGAQTAAMAFPWPVVADFRGWSGVAPQTYKIDRIPFNFLIGSGGRVLAKNITAAELDKLLSGSR